MADWFLKYYECPHCGTKWVDEHVCVSNDRCPQCDLECEPVDFEDRTDTVKNAAAGDDVAAELN
jgi:peptide subunit release factor 1 (eRF1)